MLKRIFQNSSNKEQRIYYLKNILNQIFHLYDLDMNLVSLEDKLDKLESLSKTENFTILLNLIKRLKNISKHVDHQLDPSLLLKMKKNSYTPVFKIRY